MTLKTKDQRPKTKDQRPKTQCSLTIGWLYPTLMSTYGDRGNILCLKGRLTSRGIDVRIVPVPLGATVQWDGLDLVIGGGAQDRQQALAAADMRKNKKRMTGLFDRGVPGLFVCGSPQLLGQWYMTGDGTKLEGVGLFDYVTKHFGHDKPRCIGNTAGEIDSKFKIQNSNFKNTIVGFENHGGRTYLGKDAMPFARVLRGYGNNGEDGTEGAVYKNVIACYYHGPFLPKNPHVADWLLACALAVKYGKAVELAPLPDILEWQAHDVMLKRLGVRSQPAGLEQKAAPEGTWNYKL